MCENGTSDDSARDSASSAERNLRRDKDVRNVFILAKQRKMQQDFEGLCISSHDNKFGLSAIESLGCLIGALLHLLIVGGLLHQVKDLDG